MTGTAEDKARHNIVPCFICSATFIYKGRQGDLNGRFCSMRCQDCFDAGNPPPDDTRDALIGCRVIAEPPGIEIGSDYYAAIFKRSPIAMKRSTSGFKITCVGCGKEFESRGLRSCSDKCERRHRERQDNIALMAQVGIEPAVKRRCDNPGCTNTIPKWRKGRAVSKATRFCSPTCARRAKA